MYFLLLVLGRCLFKSVVIFVYIIMYIVMPYSLKYNLKNCVTFCVSTAASPMRWPRCLCWWRPRSWEGCGSWLAGQKVTVSSALGGLPLTCTPWTSHATDSSQRSKARGCGVFHDLPSLHLQRSGMAVKQIEDTVEIETASEAFTEGHAVVCVVSTYIWSKNDFLMFSQSHYSVKKGASFLGIGTDNVILVKVDDG